jgi:hypothetical protein
MKNRNPIAVALLPFVTFGIYSLYWYVVTKGEMNTLGAKIPTAWLLIIPFANIWWVWKYSEGVEQITGAKLNGMLTFVLLFLLGSIGQAIVQDSFNNNVSAASASAAPVASAPETPVAETTPQATESTETTPPVSSPPTNPLQ